MLGFDPDKRSLASGEFQKQPEQTFSVGVLDENVSQKIKRVTTKVFITREEKKIAAAFEK
ncbi:MAG: hypothetical protein GDA53_00330 [Rhodobacteraceae bacterium]|nr:hypothetical protein [Paracoccaceae bacterium]